MVAPESDAAGGGEGGASKGGRNPHQSALWTLDALSSSKSRVGSLLPPLPRLGTGRCLAPAAVVCALLLAASVYQGSRIFGSAGGGDTAAVGEDQIAAAAAERVATDGAAADALATRPSLSGEAGSLPPVKRYGSPAVFLFVMGVEGTGHHLFNEMYRRSPSFHRLKKWGFVDDGKYGRLLGSLWNQRNPTAGIWNAHCAYLRGDRRPRGTDLLRKVAASLREMDAAIQASHVHKTDGDATVVALSAVTVKVNGLGAQGGALPKKVPMNQGPVREDAEETRETRRRLGETSGNTDPSKNEDENEKEDEKDGGFDEEDDLNGMISYPNFEGPCRSLAYPDLDILYDACDLAEVNCQHVLIHRDAHAVLRSTAINRRFGEIFTQMKLLTMMLDVIHSQIVDHPERLASCWNYDTGASSEDGRTGGGIMEVGRLLGWTESEFQEFYGEIYKPSKPMDDATREEITGDSLRPFMGSMVRAMNRARDSCRMIYDSYHPHPGREGGAMENGTTLGGGL